MAKKTSKKASDDALTDAYNKAFAEGLAKGDYVTTMMDMAGQSFIVPTNPYENEREDDTIPSWDGWRDGFDEAIMQFLDLEGISFHEFILELSKRYNRQ